MAQSVIVSIQRGQPKEKSRPLIVNSGWRHFSPKHAVVQSIIKVSATC
jgi:hypothetical protein